MSTPRLGEKRCCCLTHATDIISSSGRLETAPRPSLEDPVISVIVRTEASGLPVDSTQPFGAKVRLSNILPTLRGTDVISRGRWERIVVWLLLLCAVANVGAIATSSACAGTINVGSVSLVPYFGAEKVPDLDGRQR